eukprot:6735419-Pyramimonas_sp.AAC.2
MQLLFAISPKFPFSDSTSPLRMWVAKVLRSNGASRVDAFKHLGHILRRDRFRRGWRWTPAPRGVGRSIIVGPPNTTGAEVTKQNSGSPPMGHPAAQLTGDRGRKQEGSDSARSAMHAGDAQRDAQQLLVVKVRLKHHQSVRVLST